MQARVRHNYDLLKVQARVARTQATSLQSSLIFVTVCLRCSLLTSMLLPPTPCLVVQDPTWQVIDADATIESLQAALVEKATAVVEAAGTAPLGKLWV